MESRLPREMRDADPDAIPLPLEADAYQRAQLFAGLTNEERARFGHDPERWWSWVCRRRRAVTIKRG